MELYNKNGMLILASHSVPDRDELKKRTSAPLGVSKNELKDYYELEVEWTENEADRILSITSTWKEKSQSV